MKKAKRFLAVLLATLITATVPVSAGAEDTLAETPLFSDDFTDGFSSNNWHTSKESCAYVWNSDEGYLECDRNAVVLQSMYDDVGLKRWSKAYLSIDVRIQEFDHPPCQRLKPHYVAIWYRDQGVTDEGYEYSMVYTFEVIADNGDCQLRKKGSVTYADENGAVIDEDIDVIIATGTIGAAIPLGYDADWFNIGLKVTDGKMEGYYNDNLILSASADNGKNKVGYIFTDAPDATVGSTESPFILWNNNCRLAVDNFEVWSSDYTGFAPVHLPVHKIGDWTEAKSPDCVNTGKEVRLCENCDYFEERTLTALGHNMGEWYESTAAGCTDDGELRRDCGRCDYFETETVLALGHNFSEWVNSPDAACTADGLKQRVCGRCAEVETEVIPEKGHNLGDWYIFAGATCDTDGELRRDCSGCDLYESKPIPMHGHSYGAIPDETVDPTCTEQGYVKHFCDRCDFVLKDTFTDAAGHSYTAVETVAPTLIAEGYTVYKCGVCGDSYEADVTAMLTVEKLELILPEKPTYKLGEALELFGISVTAHLSDGTSVVLDGEYEVMGYDGNQQGDQTVTVTYMGGEASFTVTVYRLGDANGDGGVNLSDVSLTLQYVAKWETDTDTAAADVNGDGSVNLSDVTLILQYIAGWDIVLK